jgi:Na+-translocating ferredoxin:NAD+ oxidoreductase subunit B
MSNAYADLADALNALPNGFPRTETGSDLRLLECIYSEKEAEIASRLTIDWDSVDNIAGRMNKLNKEVQSGLFAMVREGKVWMQKVEGKIVFRLAPFIIGSYEASVEKMNEKMALLVEKYMIDGGVKGIMKPRPAVHRTVPILETTELEWILPYDNVLKILENAQSFHVQDCICRKQKEALGEGCDAPIHNCLSFSTGKREKIPGDITKEEAIELLKQAEEASLVHSVSNVVDGMNYICNCCGCCCGVLRGITEWGVENSMARANYEAVASDDKCIGCEVCIDRCQVSAIEIIDGIAKIDRNKCLGCGLCITTCASSAIKLMPRPVAEQVAPPETFGDWEKQRLQNRGLI